MGCWWNYYWFDFGEYLVDVFVVVDYVRIVVVIGGIDEWCFYCVWNSWVCKIVGKRVVYY